MFRLNSNQFWLVENVFSIGQFGFAQFWFVYWVYHFWLHRNWLGGNLYHAMCHPIIIFNYYKIQNYNYKKIITYCSFWYKSRCTIKLNIASNLKNEIGKNNYKLLGYFQSTRSRADPGNGFLGTGRTGYKEDLNRADPGKKIRIPGGSG